MKASSLILLIAVLVAGCSSEYSSNISPQTKKLREALKNPSTIDYTLVNDMVLKTNCVACHDAAHHKGGMDFSSFATLTAPHGDRVIVEPFNPLGSELYQVLIASGKRHMPPLRQPQLTAEQINLVYKWLDNGMRTATGEVAQHSPSLEERLQPYFAHPETIDYAAVRKYTLGTICMKCHAENGEAPNEEAMLKADFTSYASVLSTASPIVSKGRPENSKIYKVIAVDKSMPPPKRGYNPLEEIRAKLLRLWILNCAIEAKPANEVLSPDPQNPEKVRKCE